MQTAKRTSCRVNAHQPTSTWCDGSNVMKVCDECCQWRHTACRAPACRSWARYVSMHSLPPETQQGTLEFASKRQWVDFMNNRSQGSGCGMKVVTPHVYDPELTLNGYSRDVAFPPIYAYSHLPTWKYAPFRPKYPPQRPPLGKRKAGYHGYFHEQFTNTKHMYR